MPPTVIWFCGWVLKVCILLTQWIAGFDPFVAPKTSLFTVTSTQRWMQLDYGVTPVPQKRSRREVKASDELRVLARQGNAASTRRKLQQMEEQFGHHPWLKAKMVQMRRLAEDDMVMMVKEASFSAMRMSKSLASKSEVMFCMDETESNMPSFLRKKETEGRGRRTPKQN